MAAAWYSGRFRIRQVVMLIGCAYVVCSALFLQKVKLGNDVKLRPV